MTLSAKPTHATLEPRMLRMSRLLAIFRFQAAFCDPLRRAAIGCRGHLEREILRSKSESAITPLSREQAALLLMLFLDQ
jgi:hypothetical protein